MRGRKGREPCPVSCFEFSGPLLHQPLMSFRSCMLLAAGRAVYEGKKVEGCLELVSQGHILHCRTLGRLLPSGPTDTDSATCPRLLQAGAMLQQQLGFKNLLLLDTGAAVAFGANAYHRFVPGCDEAGEAKIKHYGEQILGIPTCFLESVLNEDTLNDDMPLYHLACYRLAEASNMVATLQPCLVSGTTLQDAAKRSGKCRNPRRSSPRRSRPSRSTQEWNEYGSRTGEDRGRASCGKATSSASRTPPPVQTCTYRRHL